MAKETTNSRYFIEVVAKSLDVLEVLESPPGGLTLSDICEHLNLTRSSVFRLLHTLEKRGWIERAHGGKKYRRVNRNRRYRVGYAMIGGQSNFAQDVSRGLQEASERHGMQLLVADNCFNADIALMNAQTFIKEGVDFVIECQVSSRMAPVIAHQLAQAGIPSLAIDIPQPDAVFFGVNNYEAGLTAGRALAEAAKIRWGGRVDKVILLECPDAGPTPQARITGALFGIEEMLGPVPRADVVHVDCHASLAESYRITQALLSGLPSDSRILIAAINDPSAVGAVRALESMNRAEYSLVVGHNATREARAELRNPASSLLGSVGYFPEKYGEQIIPLVIKVLQGAAVPPAIYIEHRMITRENVMQYYANDTDQSDQIERDVEAELLAEGRTAAPATLIFS